jgi:TonB family protein
MSHVQKVLDVVGQTGLKVQMISVDLAELKERNRPKDLNNIEFYQADVKPEPIHQVAPEYPEIARKAGLTGKVFLKFRVNVDGSVSDVSVLRGQQIFRKAAMEAIEKFRFKPAEYDGKIVAVWMTQPVSFRLGLGKPLEAQTLDLGTFTIKVPNGHDGNALIQPRLTLNVISAGAADVITDDLDKAQKMASSYLSSIPLDQWVSAEQQNAILEGVREQVNVGFGAPLINSVTFSNLTLTPSEYLAENREFKLHTNFPNPFNPETAIKYEVAEPVFVRMEIYNVTGQVIRTLVAEDKSPGKYETRWDGKDDQGKLVASGVYYYHINAGSFNAVKKMQLVK